MFSNYFKSIEGVTIFPVIGLLFFFAIFIGIVVWVIRMDKKHAEKMSSLPLDHKDNLSNNSEMDHENKKNI